MSAATILALVETEIESRLGNNAVMRANQGTTGYEKESLSSLMKIRKELKAEVNAGKSTTNYGEMGQAT